MKDKALFPIRFKILIVLLFITTVVLGLITFTMAKLFHADKTAYIHDLTSVIALHTAEEASTLLVGYRERLQVFAQVMVDQNLEKDRKVALIKLLFNNFQEFVAVTIYKGGESLAMVHDAAILEEADLLKEDLLKFRSDRPLPLDRIRTDKTFIENSTVSERLPTLNIAIVLNHTNGEERIVEAVVRLEGLLRLANRSKVFETSIIDEEGTLLSHTDRNRVVQHEKMDWVQKVKGLEGEQSVGKTLEYFQDGVELVGGFSPVAFSGLFAGIQIPKEAAYLTARELLNNLIWVSLALLTISAFISLFWSRRITEPIERLSEATRLVGSGQFDIQVKSSSRDEIGKLADSFNQMARELKTREDALKQAQAALIQSEKMAAFGQLGAGIAHEVKNPLAGILGYAQLSKRKVEKDTPIYKNLEVIEKETKRCKTIIDNLMKFARKEKVVQEPMAVNLMVEDALAIVDHQLSINKVKLEKELAPDLPQVIGSANQLQQVLMNLMINAQQAMGGESGKVRLSTRQLDSNRIEIRVSDTGPGIPEEIQAKIFEPFFTTKPVGKGTGLGLSVTYGIIKDHGGEIRLESAPGEGTTFIITLPAEAGQASSVATIQTAA